MHVVVIGSGAMGALFGGLLADAGQDVTLVDIWEEHVETMAREGLQIETPEGDRKTISVKATTDASTISDADLALVFVKSIHTGEAIRDAQEVLDGVDVLTLQNGLGNAEALAEVVDESKVIAGVTAHGSTLLEPGVIRHAGRGETTIGRYFAANDRRVNEIANIFTEAGIETAVSGEIQEDIWEKVLVNIGINPATALSRIRNGTLAETDAGNRLVARAISEGKDVAETEGYAVRDDIVEYVLDVAEQTGENKSSMRQDVEANRKTEIERLNGEVIRRADRHDIDVPANEMLTDLIRLTEEGYLDS